MNLFINVPVGGMRENGGGRIMQEANLIKIYFKHICKYHNVSPVQLLYANKIIKILL
jgi:hypothetical protein